MKCNRFFCESQKKINRYFDVIVGKISSPQFIFPVDVVVNRSAATPLEIETIIYINSIKKIVQMSTYK